MTRNTVDFGIDLGTTNSKIACIRDGEPRVIKNDSDNEITPSVVYVHPRGEIYVGQVAKQRWMSDTLNTKAWFKRVMGRQMQFKFESGRTMTPEELSAEVLKSLRSDVHERLGEDMRAAVITVPAMFPAESCAATQRAARMAGIEFSPLLMEPVASALAYGFQISPVEGFLMVYDLGGGTFDTSLMKVEAGRIDVVDHDGDNQLGGTDFDKLIVNKIIIPKLEKKYALQGINWGEESKEYGTAYRKLLYYTEIQKILLSRKEMVTLDVPDLCQDTRGVTVDVEEDISRADYEALLNPFLEKTTRLCRDLMERNGLTAADINKLLLVGGPTHTPLIRRKLQSDLGIELEFRIDPLTVVAQGAAVFAATQKISPNIPKETGKRGTYKVDLEYPPITMESEVSVGGKVSTENGTPPNMGFTLELERQDKGWRSGKIPLNQSGVFLTTVPLQPKKTNEFSIGLSETTGIKVEVIPDNFRIMPGLPPGQVAIVARSLGIGLAGNDRFMQIEKGSALPLKTKRTVYHTTIPIKRGETKDVIVIPIIEGENPRADRNRHLTDLIIHGEKVRLDLPKDTEIEVEMQMDESRSLQVRAYVPLLDEEFSATIQPYAQMRAPNEIAKTLNDEKERLRKIEAQNQEHRDPEVIRKVAAIRGERLFEELEQNISLAVRGDKDSLALIQDRILDLQARIDEVESLLSWPNLERDARALLADVKKVVNEYGNESEKSRLRELEGELESAISARKSETLEIRVSDLSTLRLSILTRQPGFWVALFKEAKAAANESTDPGLAHRLVMRGEQAIQMGDENTLREVTIQIVGLLTSPPPIPGSGYSSHVKFKGQ